MTEPSRPPHSEGLVRFGVFEFDPATGDLWKSGRHLRLPEQPRQVLRMLVARPGEVVSRDELRRALWPDDTFVDFDTGLNVVINRIRQALDDSASSPRFIETFARRGYRFIAPIAAPAQVGAAVGSHASMRTPDVVVPVPIDPSRQMSPPRPASRRRAVVGGALSLAFASLVVAGLWLWRHASLPSPSMVQLSSERWAGAGSFSPDGTLIAYASAGDDGVNWDIRVKMVGEPESRRLTTDPAVEDFPAWSPTSGTQIAFLRYRGGSVRGLPYGLVGTIYLISPLGGPARQLSDFPARTALSWSPDERWLAAAKGASGEEPAGGIYMISISTGEARAVTFPKAPAADKSPAFSPDGRQLAYASCVGSPGTPMCDLRVVRLDSDARPLGTPRKLPVPLASAFGLAWSPDGRWIVFSQGSLWRVRADGSAPPELLGFGLGRSPSFAGARDRLAFVTGGGTDIYEFQEGGSPLPLIQSAIHDIQPQFSADGDRIAFASDRGRGGTIQEIWIANADGSNPVQVTHGPGNQQGYPGWSPADKRTIVFDSRAENGHADIWTIDASGSNLRPITHDPAEDILPSFSHDGKYIYFSSNRTGRFEIWRTPATGKGPDEPLTHNGGSFPHESWDGEVLYYKRGEMDDGPLFGRPTAGGDEQPILPCVVSFGYAVAPGGIFYHQCGIDSPMRSLRYWDATTEGDRAVGSLDADYVGGLSVSPNGKRIIYGRGEATSSLMMIENFR